MGPLIGPGMSPAPTPGSGAPPTDPLMHKARELEAAFLSEMLQYSGLDGQSGSFSGGAGEEQFSSFLRLEQARQRVDHGGIGLAEQLFRAMGGKTDG